MTRRDLLRTTMLALFSGAACKNTAFTCADTSDLSGLSADDAQARSTLAYADMSLDALKNCANCQQFVAAQGKGCGTCKIMKGPVHPQGYCKVYAPKG